MIAGGSRLTLIRRSPSATSISVSSLSVRSWASSRTKSGSIRMEPFCSSSASLGTGFAPWAILYPLLNLALGLVRARSLAEVRGRVQCEHVAERPEPDDRAARDLADQALPAKALARVNVGE